MKLRAYCCLALSFLASAASANAAPVKTAKGAIAIAKEGCSSFRGYSKSLKWTAQLSRGEWVVVAHMTPRTIIGMTIPENGSAPHHCEEGFDDSIEVVPAPAKPQP